MLIIFQDEPSFSGRVCEFNLIPSEHTETSIWSQRMMKFKTYNNLK